MKEVEQLYSFFYHFHSLSGTEYLYNINDTISSTSKTSTCRLFMKELLYGFLTNYETPKIVMVHSYTVTISLRLMQTILLLYSVFYLLIYEKGYQKHDTSIISSVMLKVKGMGYIRTPSNESFVFDGADYIIPPSENNAIFIMTNFIETAQSRSTCTESISLSAAKCTTDRDCQNKSYVSNINGRWTGRCSLLPERNTLNRTKITTKQTGLCEMQGWCPVEDDLQESTAIKEIRNFTVFIKNFIEFPIFNVKHKNMVEDLKPCIYHPIKNRDCPIFGLDYIMNEAEKDTHERELMLLHGGVIRVKLEWDCNLDRSIKLCRPIYSFARLDTPFREETFSIGFNFRFASHWRYNQTNLRSLTKAFGLRFIISVSGKAGKFDFLTLTLNTGSLVGIFGLATFICDYILLNLTKKAPLYREQVFQRVRLQEELKNNAFQSIQKLNGNMATTYENLNAYDLQMTPSFRIFGSMESFSDTRHSSIFVNEDQLLRLQPSLGLTNSMK